MVNRATQSQFPILQEGHLQEELWEWSDIEALAKAGRLSPNSLIFYADENVWKKVKDTELAEYLGSDAPKSEDQDAISPGVSERQEEYENLLRDIRENPKDLNPLLHAADIALAMGNGEAARGHYQRALETNPYHPRVVQEAKRNLPRGQWRTLPFLEKPPPIWEDPIRLVSYPLTRGPLYIVIPTLAIWGLSWTVWSAIPALLVLGLWTMEVIRVSSQGDRRPPLWDGLVSDPMGTIARPLLAMAGAVAQLCLPFVAIAAILVLSGQSGGASIPTVIGKSPFMSVMMFTASLFYLPAVFILISAHAARIRDVLNPKYVVAAIRIMEGEYIALLAFVLFLLGVTWGLGRLLGSIPFVARFFYAAAVTYMLLASGLVLGRLYSRIKEQLDQLTRRESSDA